MGGKQLGFGYYEQSTAKKCNMGLKFLAEQQQVVPWKVLIDLMKPHYPKTNSMGSRPAYPLATMSGFTKQVPQALPLIQPA
jgi:IS5 family transposase